MLFRSTSFVAWAAGISAQTSYVTARDVLTSPPITPKDSGSVVDGFELRAEEDVELLYEEAFETLQPGSFMDFNDYLNEKKNRKRTAGVSESYLGNIRWSLIALHKDHPLQEWTKDVDEWLSELLRLEGRGNCTSDACTRCSLQKPLYRCDDCNDLRLYCGYCTVLRHHRIPLHRIKVTSIV